MKKIEKVSNKFYNKILENMPVFCVDIIIFHKKKVLLVKRKEEPAKDKWWIPGGRVYKNEKIEETARRKALEEINLQVEIKRVVGVYDYFSDKGKFPNLKTGTHTIVVFLATLLDKNQEIVLNHTYLIINGSKKLEKIYQTISEKF